METFKQFEDLEIWHLTVDLTVDVYNLCEKSPKLKSGYSARDNIKRVSTSISNNIAEGIEYNSNKQFVKYLNISKGFAGETRSQLFLLRKINYIVESDFIRINSKCLHLSKQIAGFIKYLKGTINK